MSDLAPEWRFRITDQREEAIRQRATASVIWSEDEGRVPVPVADALWAAVRDRETLLGTLDRERAIEADAPLDGLRAKVDALRGMAWERPEGWVNLVDRAAVLAIIDALRDEGETPAHTVETVTGTSTPRLP